MPQAPFFKMPQLYSRLCAQCRPGGQQLSTPATHNQFTRNAQFTCNRAPATPFKKSMKRQLSLQKTRPFRPFHGCTVRLTRNLHRASQTAPCCAPMLGSVPIHQPHPMPAIAILRFSQSREINFQIFLEEPGHLYYFDPLTTNQVMILI